MTNLNRSQFPLDDPQGLLEPDPLYHGTSSFEPKVGDKILPPKKSGAPSYWGHLDNDIGYGQSVTKHAFAAPEEISAWQFAKQRAVENSHIRPAVYAVRPLGDIEPGAEGDHEVRSKAGFEVTGRHDIMPGHQGTLPLNWAQHVMPGNAFRANHPANDYEDDTPNTRAYPAYAGNAADEYVHRQAKERSAVEAGQGELFDSKPHVVSDLHEKAAAMIRYHRGEINEQGQPETRKFPYYPRKGA